MRPIAILAMTAMIVVFGCQKADRIVGSWAYRTELLGGKLGSQGVLTFEPNGTFTDEAVVSQFARSPRLLAHDKGTWKALPDGSYDCPTTDTNWSVSGGTKEQAARIVSRLTIRKAEILAEANKDSVIKPVWTSDDQFKVTQDGKTTVYTRTK